MHVSQAVYIQLIVECRENLHSYVNKSEIISDSYLQHTELRGIIELQLKDFTVR